MIPDFQTLMLPVLKSCANGAVSSRDVITSLANEFKLTPEEQEQMLPSGRQATFANRVHWAKTYLKQAGLISYPSRGKFELTSTGKEVLNDNPDRIDVRFLGQFDLFREFKDRKGNRSDNSSTEEKTYADDSTPDEDLQLAYETIKKQLAQDLLDKVRNSKPDFFEKLIVRLLVSMGYGGKVTEPGRILGKSGDDGVDGVIDQDPLGIDQIYVQAKRYKDGNNVGSSAIRDFSGSLDIKNTKRGIFFTSSNFTDKAIKTVEKLGKQIVLIDGKRLANLMVEYNIGCREEDIIRLKKIDEEYFEDE